MKFALKLTKTQYLIILGTAISGLGAFINTYDAIAKIAEKKQVCEESDALKQALQTRFIVMIVLSCVAMVLGVVLGFIWNRKGGNEHKVISYGIGTAGLFGLVYSLTSKFNNYAGTIKLTISWTSFIAFIALGFYFSQRSGGYGDDDDDIGED